jgi:hypothetical protein
MVVRDWTLWTQNKFRPEYSLLLKHYVMMNAEWLLWRRKERPTDVFTEDTELFSRNRLVLLSGKIIALVFFRNLMLDQLIIRHHSVYESLILKEKKTASLKKNRIRTALPIGPDYTTHHNSKLSQWINHATHIHQLHSCFCDCGGTISKRHRPEECWPVRYTQGDSVVKQNLCQHVT